MDDPAQDPDYLGNGGAYDPYQEQVGPGPYRPRAGDPYYGRRRVTDPYALQGDIYARPYPRARRYDPYWGGYQTPND